MQIRVRALLAALIILAAAFGGTLYLSHSRGVGASELGVATEDLHWIFSPKAATDQHLLDVAFRRVQGSFYRPVAAQTLLSGEHNGLLAYLKSKRILHPALPPIVATGDRAIDERRMQDQLHVAEALYGRSFGNAPLTQAAIGGMMNSLNDPYTTYLSPHDNRGLHEILSGGNFGGVGVYIVEDHSGNVVVAPIPGTVTPASRAGVQALDIVDAVDGHAVKGMKLDLVEELIRGPEGSVVRMKVHGHNSHRSRTLSVVRATIHVPSVRAKVEDGFEYIQLFDFGESSAAEVARALFSGRAHGVRGYILDLRNNGGGLLDAAVAISSFFIPSGTIVSTVDREGNRTTESARNTLIGATPLVVLVNKFSASASEITAGAIQDYKAGTLIGTKTFGKGVVQSIYPLPDDGALKITTARYLTPLGRDIQHKGIEPDIKIEQNPTVIDTPADKQLKAAKTYLRRLAHR